MKRLVKGKEVMVYWKSSYYRGFVKPSKAIYLGRDKKGAYMVQNNKGVAHLTDRKMIQVI